MLHYRITTPEQVFFHHEIAGLVTRAMAWGVDFLIQWTLWIVLGLTMCNAAGRAGLSDEGLHLAAAIFFLLTFALDFSYHVFFELYREGQSPGKRLMGIRVISGGGGKLRFADVMMRNLVRPIDMLPYMMVVGGVAALLDRYHRRLGDLVADTIIIRDASRTIPTALLAAHARINSFQNDPSVRTRILARVTRDERDLMLDLMLRRDELDAETREELFSLAAAHFRKRYGLPEDLAYLTDEQTVLNLALVVQGTKVG